MYATDHLYLICLLACLASPNLTEAHSPCHARNVTKVESEERKAWGQDGGCERVLACVFCVLVRQ